MGDALGNAVNILASLSSLAIYLSPAPSLYRIMNERKAGDVSILPLVSMFGSCFVWGTYGFLVNNLFPLFATMAIGCVLAGTYTTIYCKYTTQPMRVAKILSCATAFLMLVMTYVALGVTGKTGQTTDEVATVIGYVGSIVSFLLYSSPFEKIAQVLRTRSAACIPIGLCIASAIGNILWTVSGALNFDLFVLLPNAVCSVPPMIQIALYVMFRPKKQSAILLLNQHTPSSPSEARAAPKAAPSPPAADQQDDLAYHDLATPAHSDTVILID